MSLFCFRFFLMTFLRVNFFAPEFIIYEFAFWFHFSLYNLIYFHLISLQCYFYIFCLNFISNIIFNIFLYFLLLFLFLIYLNFFFIFIFNFNLFLFKFWFYFTLNFILVLVLILILNLIFIFNFNSFSFYIVFFYVLSVYFILSHINSFSLIN